MSSRGTNNPKYHTWMRVKKIRLEHEKKYGRNASGMEGTKKKSVTKKRSSTHRKYNLSRPSPKYSATEYNIGIVKTGNDGNKYIVKKTANGVKRWVKK